MNKKVATCRITTTLDSIRAP